jgi:hypothetical protein
MLHPAAPRGETGTRFTHRVNDIAAETRHFATTRTFSQPTTLETGKSQWEESLTLNSSPLPAWGQRPPALSSLREFRVSGRLSHLLKQVRDGRCSMPD